MPNELYQTFAGNQSSPKEQALALMRQNGIQVPDSIMNNPGAIIQHLMQSGRVPQSRFSMAQQIFSRMFRR